MASSSAADPTPILTPSVQPTELSFPLPRSAETRIHLHLSRLTHALLLFLTTTPGGSGASLASLGSFVYALPDRRDPKNIVATPLYAHESSLDATRRLATLLARKLQMPVYVGNSVSFATAGLGGTVEEEMDGLKRCIDVVVALVHHRGPSEP